MGKLTAEMDSSKRDLGSGGISGMVSVVLAVIGFCAVLCLLYPALLTFASVSGSYHM